VHAQQLVAALDGQAVMVSRIGPDALGQKLLGELRSRKLSTAYLQIDPEHPTGTVRVTFDQGEPRYEIVRDVAWDYLTFTPDLRGLVSSCQAVCFGSLGQREALAHQTIYYFLQSAMGAIRLFDVNLRQRFYNERVLRRSLELSSVAKLNLAELPIVARELGLKHKGTVKGPALFDELAEALLKEFDLATVVLTRGAQGTVLYTRQGRLEGAPVHYPPQPNADSVGAGDACSAGLLVGMVLGWSAERTLALANRMGAYVASVCGATPTLPAEILRLVRDAHT
jgi:fructokinase